MFFVQAQSNSERIVALRFWVTEKLELNNTHFDLINISCSFETGNSEQWRDKKYLKKAVNRNAVHIRKPIRKVI